MDKVNRDVAL